MSQLCAWAARVVDYEDLTGLHLVGADRAMDDNVAASDTGLHGAASDDRRGTPDKGRNDGPEDHAEPNDHDELGDCSDPVQRSRESHCRAGGAAQACDSQTKLREAVPPMTELGAALFSVQVTRYSLVCAAPVGAQAPTPVANDVFDAPNAAIVPL